VIQSLQQQSKISSCGFLPKDSSAVLYGSWKQLNLWRYHSGSPQSCPEASIVSSIATHSNYIASASHDSTVKLWQLT